MSSAEDTEELTIKWTKVLISGPPETGKSSSIKLLLGEAPNLLHDSTPIIKPVWAVVQSSDKTWTKIESIIDHVQSKISTSSNESDEQHFICITDTGGQAAFLDIAPAFLRGKSAVVNIVTQKLTKGLKDDAEFFYSVQGKRIGDPVKRKLTNEQVLDWLVSSIVSLEGRGPNEESFEIVYDSSKPSVLVFGTFCDQLLEFDFDERRKFLNEYLDKFGKDVAIQKFRGDSRFFPLIANKPSSEQMHPSTFEKIRSRICMSYTKAKISRNQLQLLKGIQDCCQDEKKTTIPVEELGKKHNMKPDDVQKTLLSFHDLSGVSYFTKLPNVVFLKPQNVVDDISLLISISFAEGSDYIEDTLKIYDMPNDALENMQHGYFKKEVIKKIARSCDSSDLLTLMIELHITAEFESNKYFLPCVLLTAGEEEISTLQESYSDKFEPLIVSWDNKVIPRGLFCTLVTLLLKDDRIKLVELNKRGKQKTNFYRNAIQLVYKPSGGILLIDSVTYIEIYYNGQKANCYEIKEFIFKCLRTTIKELHCSPDYQIQFFCKQEKCDYPSVHLCFLSELDLKTLTCPYGSTVTTSEVTSRQHPWLGDEVYLLEPPPLHELCADIKVFEPKKIQSLAIQLRISDEQRNIVLDRFYHLDSLTGVFETWLKECSKPTRHQVIEALHAIGENQAADEYVKKIEERTLKDNIENSKKLDVDTILIAFKKIKFDMKTTFDLAEKLDLSLDWFDENQEKYKDENLETILKEFLSRWLQGYGKSPKTYGTLRTALTNLPNRHDALIEKNFPASN